MRALTIVLLAALVLPACTHRTVSETVVDRYGLEIRLRSRKPLFGGKPEARGFDHPVEISPLRLQTILGGIQVDMRPSDSSTIRERDYAIPRKLLPVIADGLSEAFAQAGPDQELVVMALRKQMQKGIFNRKYLTSFVTWIQDGELYVDLARLDWKTDLHPEDNKFRARDRVPVPEVGEIVMPFTAVPDEHYQVVARQTVKAEWRSAAFGGMAIEKEVMGTRAGADDGEATSDAAGAPADDAAEAATGEAAMAAGAATTASDAAAAAGATAAGAGAAEAGAAGSAASPSGDAAAAATGGAGVAGAVSGPTAGDAPGSATDALRGLSADDLRQLADLEEARAAGRIDDSEYEVRRRAILNGGGR
jgi:hypothetical protein